jgi:hypothetical protein
MRVFFAVLVDGTVLPGCGGSFVTVGGVGSGWLATGGTVG